MSYSIKPLILAKNRGCKAQMTYFVGWDEQIWTGTIFWYIKGADRHILVDTGISYADNQKYGRGRPSEEIMSFETALGTVGIAPDDVGMVIQTHLHFDHCGHTRMCRNAEVIVQEEELKFAYSPHALFSGSYNLSYLKDLKFRVISGDTEILPGIRVVHVPGHSPGAQAVSVETEKGSAAICGFCTIKDNFYPPEKFRTKWPVLTPGVSVNSLQAFDSTLKIKSMADIIIPLHDLEVNGQEEIPASV
jgi:glyoxylase-like metal-dependent hydrolase (beta-lactamase superfamily II)